MDSFEIKDLLTVKGKPGLWKLVAWIPSSKMVRVKNLTNDDIVATVKGVDVAAINDYKIYLTNGEMSLENVFNFIMEMEEKGEVSTEELDSYEKLSEVKKTDMMKKLVPDYDENQFKHYHLTKIIKWYKELVKALDMFEEDQYKKEVDRQWNELDDSGLDEPLTEPIII